jgi:hypothetical protein
MSEDTKKAEETKSKSSKKEDIKVDESFYKKATKAKAKKDAEAAEKKRELDMKLHAEMKRMEIEKRRKMLEENKGRVVIDSGRKDDLIDFDAWWMNVSKRVKMHSWMKEIVKADFKARGLKNAETIEKFDETLRIFGVKF